MAISELGRIKAILASDRVALDGKAVRWCTKEGVAFSTLREAITLYLAELDEMSPEWADWIDAYGESKLARLFRVEI
jgi:hypothetical protein